MKRLSFDLEELSVEDLARLREISRLARGDILKMTTLAGSGHPGGSMSSIDIYVVLYSCARLFPGEPNHPDRDRIVISHGHTSPGVYAALGRLGFFDLRQAISTFRRAGSIFEGHVERGVPGVEWGTGNLGQGLSVGCGLALAGRLWGRNNQVFVVMGDGEQQKGQISEARRFAKKYDLANITVIVDLNGLQISGATAIVMPQRIRENYLSDGWEALEIDGHNHQEIYGALRRAVRNTESPVVIFAHTVMGKSVSFMENKEEFHGKALTVDQFRRAMEELGIEDDLDEYRKMQPQIEPPSSGHKPLYSLSMDTGKPRTYTASSKIDARSAFGKALEDIANLNIGKEARTPIAVLDCDLSVSVKTDGFARIAPDRFFQGGIQEHNTSSIAGALSKEGVLTFFADFGVFGIDETYNQQRLNDINNTNLKLVCTHNGLDVGEDGKTHQCVDYIGIVQNLFGYKILVPADPNQTDRMVRYMARESGNFLLAVGRSHLPVILDEEGSPLFGDGYEFVYGRADVIRKGKSAAIITCGSMVHRALRAWEALKSKGVEVLLLSICCLSDLDIEALRLAATTGVIITYEDHNVRTGLGSVIANALAEEGLTSRFRKMGMTDYGGSGTPEDLYKMQGLDVDSLIGVVLEEITKSQKCEKVVWERAGTRAPASEPG